MLMLMRAGILVDGVVVVVGDGSGGGGHVFF